MNKRIGRKMELLHSYLPVNYFIVFRIVTSLLLFILLFIFSRYGYIIAPLFTFIYYVFLEIFFLDYGIKLRRECLEEDSIEFFNVFLASLRGNRQIKSSLEISCKVVDNDLSRELKSILDRLHIGISLNEELEKYLNSVPSEYVRNILISIIEANKLGNNLNDSIPLELKYIENKNKTKKVNRLYMKLLFTLMGIILIGILFTIYVILIKELLIV